MRGLSDAVFYRPDRSIRYQHIDPLFGDEIDWNLIATHARDMIQVVLSIQAGRVMPSMLLRKLGKYNRKSLLYRSFPSDQGAAAASPASPAEICSYQDDRSLGVGRHVPIISIIPILMTDYGRERKSKPARFRPGPTPKRAGGRIWLSCRQGSATVPPQGLTSGIADVPDPVTDGRLTKVRSALLKIFFPERRWYHRRAPVQRSVQDLASLQYQWTSSHASPPSGTSRPSGSAMPHREH